MGGRGSVIHLWRSLKRQGEKMLWRLVQSKKKKKKKLGTVFASDGGNRAI